jgi:hypothetical protein
MDMDRWPTLPLADILGMGRQERSWDSVPGAGCLRPGASDRSRGISDLGMAGLHISAPARLQRGRRAAQPGGSSTPLVRDPGELLSRTYSGSSASIDYRRQLELNAQDSDEDVLFLQMWYPERGAGRTEILHLCSCWRSRNIRLRPSWPLSNAEADAGGVRRTGLGLVVRRPEQVVVPQQ